MSTINSENAEAWRAIASALSRQRPIMGRRVIVVRGRKHRGETATVVGHYLDRFDRTTFRYGNEASYHMREMAGRSGYVCLVEGERDRFWVKAKYLACIDASYEHWTAALADAVMISGGA